MGKKLHIYFTWEILKLYDMRYVDLKNISGKLEKKWKNVFLGFAQRVEDLKKIDCLEL